MKSRSQEVKNEWKRQEWIEEMNEELKKPRMNEEVEEAKNEWRSQEAKKPRSQEVKNEEAKNEE